MKPLTTITGKLPSLEKIKKFKLGGRSSTSSVLSTDSQDGVVGPTPLKAIKRGKSRKSSTENLFNGGTEKSGPLRASSMEDIHSLSSQSASGKAGGNAPGKIVDAVVKLYLPDHSHKYLDISPVSLRL